MTNTTTRTPINTRLKNIFHDLEVGEAIMTFEPRARELAGSISRTTKRYGIRLQTTAAPNGAMIVEAVAA